MAEKLTFEYDRDADILYINKRESYAEQESEELGDEVVARLNPTTGEVESVEVMFFSTRTAAEQPFRTSRVGRNALGHGKVAGTLRVPFAMFSCGLAMLRIG